MPAQQTAPQGAAETVPVQKVFAPGGSKFRLDKEDMLDACAGACILASGGGGSYQVSLKIVEEGVGAHDVAQAIPPGALPAKSWAAVSANMGSPDALFKTANPHAAANAFRALQDWCRTQPRGSRFSGFKEFAACIPVEVGAINTASPLTTAVQMKIPVVDADGAGRSIPTLPLTTYAREIPFFPNYVASEAPPGKPYNTGQIDIRATKAVEEAAEEAIIGLVMTPPFAGIAGLAVYAQQGSDLEKHPPVPGTLYDALQIGSAVKSRTGKARAQAVVDYLTSAKRPGGPRRAAVVFRGRVKQMVQAEGGTDIGSIVLHGRANGDTKDVDLWIFNQNENIFCARSDQEGPLVMGPDSICYVPAEGDVFDNSDLWKLWQSSPKKIPEVFVVAVAAPQQVTANDELLKAWQAERAQFGYPGPFAQPWLHR